MKRPAPGKLLKFEVPKEVTFMWAGGITVGFASVVSLLETTSGGIELQKSDDSYVAITSGWHYYEVGEPGEQ
jgi:hypothetical protein